jgi:hypothetical protein
MKYLIYVLPLLFSLADALMFRAKTDPVIIWQFNLFLELSKLCYIGMIVTAIMIGKQWKNRYIIPLILIHFVAKSIPFNLIAGLEWNYIGTGIFDTFIKLITQASVWMWLVLQAICIGIAQAIIRKKL